MNPFRQDPPAPDPEREPAAAHAAVSPSRTLLLVDDDPDILRAYARALRRRYQVTTALGGRQALETLARAEGRFDVVICDLTMPDVDGIDVRAWLMQHVPGLERRMIFITGGAVIPRAREFLRSLSTPWLQKPFEMSDLLRLVDQVSGGTTG